MSDMGAEQGRGAAMASLAGGILALAGLLFVGFQLRGMMNALDALAARIDKIPPASAGGNADNAGNGGEPDGEKPAMTAAQLAKLQAQMATLQSDAGKLQSDMERRILIDDPNADLPSLGPADLEKFAGAYIEHHETVERQKFAKERAERCIQLADSFYMKQNLAVNLKLSDEQKKKVSEILRDEFSRGIEYLGRKDHPSDEATALKNSILNAADEKIRALLDKDQLKLYPRYKADWVGGVFHIAGDR